MRLVFDTNVLIAALRSRRGASNVLLIEVLRGKTTWVCSVPLFLEYEDVTTRAEFLLATGYKKTDVVQFLNNAAAEIEPIELNFLWRPQLRDPKDEMVLETAANGRADALVTHNTRDFTPAASLFSFELLTPSEAIRRLKP